MNVTHIVAQKIWNVDLSFAYHKATDSVLLKEESQYTNLSDVGRLASHVRPRDNQKFFFTYNKKRKRTLQCSTLIFLLTCPLGNYVASFTCRVYFLVAQKKSPARFAGSFIEFSILVPSNFYA